MYPANGQEFEEVIDEYTMMYTKIHNLVYSQVNKVDDAIQNIKESFGTTDATNGYTTSKLMQIKFLYHLCLLSDTKRDNLLTEMLYLAQKKGPQFGPFGKLY
jgi:archaellum component FlaF (FlaF/FlaG flagellin family)